MTYLLDNKNKFLVIAAHPDDEILGMGGLLARSSKLGILTTILFLGEGISARFEKNDFGKKEYNVANSQRSEGAKNAMKLLGIKDVIFNNFLCCRFDSYEILDIVKLIEKTINNVNPSHIFTHNPIEVNIDHRIVYRAVETAVRPKPELSLKEIYTFEIPCSGNWTFENQFDPNTFIDIKDVFEKKIQAWNCYAGEERPFPFPRSRIGLETMAKYRGMQCGLQYAEALKLVRKII